MNRCLTYVLTGLFGLISLNLHASQEQALHPSAKECRAMLSKGAIMPVSLTDRGECGKGSRLYIMLYQANGWAVSQFCDLTKYVHKENLTGAEDGEQVICTMSGSVFNPDNAFMGARAKMR